MWWFVLESHPQMGGVAERFRLGFPTAAEGDGLPFGDGERHGLGRAALVRSVAEGLGLGPAAGAVEIFPGLEDGEIALLVAAARKTLLDPQLRHRAGHIEPQLQRREQPLAV